AWLIRLDPDLICVARNDVALAVQCGYPETVDYVGALQVDLHDETHRQSKLVRGAHAHRRNRVLIFDVPPPLTPGDVDHDAIVGLEARQFPGGERVHGDEPGDGDCGGGGAAG